MRCSLLIAVLACGCSAERAPGDDGGDSGGDASRPTFRRCHDGLFSSGRPTEDWRHTASEITVALGAPGHSAQDVIAIEGEPTAVVGKFAYGVTSKDLEDEKVEVWLDDCFVDFRLLGSDLTDSDGRTSFPLAGGDVPSVGSYTVVQRVVGDDSRVFSTLWVVRRATRAMVLDIDGTLTTDDLELVTDIAVDLFEPILGGSYVPEARSGASALTNRRRNEQGYLLVYLTGRPYVLTDKSREWLWHTDMARGVLHTTDSNAEVLPTEAGVGGYKTDYLEHLQSLGLELVAAYGNASTDIYAYDLAGVPKERTYILGTNGGAEQTVDLGDDYLAHVDDIAAEPAAEQPFNW